MLNEISYWWLVILISSAATLIAVSVVVYCLYDRKKLYDHVSRSLVQIGLAAVAGAIALLVYNSNIENGRENDRLLAAQSFRRATLQYGTVVFHLRATRRYCDIDTEDANRVRPPKKNYFNPTDCRQASAFATKTSALLPGIEFIFIQAAKVSRAFPGANYVAIFMTDADAALRSRVPAVIETNISLYVSGGKSQLARDAAKKFANEMSNLQNNAEAIAAVFCVLADRIDRGWKELDATIAVLEKGLEEEVAALDKLFVHDQPNVYPSVVRELAEKTKFRAANCTNIRDELLKLLPATGAGDGGGNGG